MVKSDQRYYIVLWAMITAYVAVFFTSSLLRFYSFDFTDFDLAVYNQIVWQIPYGDLVSSVLRVNFLGHHAHFLAFPLALIYRILPHPGTLLFIQTLVCGLGALPLFLIALRILNARWALTVAACYLLYPGLGFLNYFEFHFTPFATLSLLYACYFFIEKRRGPFFIAIIVTLLVQENLSLIVFAFGLYALILRRSFKWWMVLLLLGGFYFIFCIKYLFPTLNPDKIQFISIYSHFGNSYKEIVTTLIAHPIQTFSYLFTKARLMWLFGLFSPLVSISLIAPIHLIPAVPIFLQHLLSNRTTELSPYYHYAAELIPFIFLSFIFGLRKLTAIRIIKTREPMLMITVFLVAFWTAFAQGPQLLLFERARIVQDADDSVRKYFLSKIPPEASLITTFRYMSHVSHRKNLYSFHHINGGHYTLSEHKYELPQGVEFALIDLHDPLTFVSYNHRQSYKNFQGMIDYYDFHPILVRDNTVLFKSGGESPFQLTRRETSHSLDNNNSKPLFDSNGVVLKSAIADRSESETLNIELTWYAKEDPVDHTGIYFLFLDNSGKVHRKLYSTVCYRIFPTQSWKAGQWFSDHKYLTIPSELQDQEFTMKLGYYFFDQNGSFVPGKEVPIEMRNNRSQ